MTLLNETTRADLTAALAQSERALALPIIPGELDAWARRGQTELTGLAARWLVDEDRRQRTLRSIVEEDIELAQRVRRLRERQGFLTEELEGLKAALTSLTGERAGSWQPIADAEELRERALLWVVRARAFGTELEAWRREATYRDRGEVD